MSAQLTEVRRRALLRALREIARLGDVRATRTNFLGFPFSADDVNQIHALGWIEPRDRGRNEGGDVWALTDAGRAALGGGK